MGRVLILYAACWCGVFALFHLVQSLVVVAPGDLQPALSAGWAVGATVYAIFGTIIIHRAQRQ